MLIGKIIGNCTSTVKDETYENKPLLIVEQIDCYSKSMGKQFIAIDLVGAGKDEIVLLMREGSSSNQLLKTADKPKKTPAEAVIVGIIDEMEVENNVLYKS